MARTAVKQDTVSVGELVAQAPGVTLSDLRQVVPGPGMPPEARIMRSNNNLDLARHDDGRIYFAFRSAPTHFAHPACRFYVMASDDDGENWQLEAKIKRGRDMREPRLLSWNGRLFLYFFEAGRTTWKFEPNGIFACERRPDGMWTEPVEISPPGYVVWRTKVVNGVPYMTAYSGGANQYANTDEELGVELLTTTDGYRWTPVNSARPAVYRGGGSECDFEIADDGTLYAVIRNEGGGDGYGSLICRAPADDITDWRCRLNPRKYDSPLVFKHADEIYILGRRHLRGNGHYDQRWPFLSAPRKRFAYQILYWLSRKRTSLWRINKETLRVKRIFDLPSRGDTCFPALVPLNERQYLVYNYSSPLEGPDKFWFWGQVTQTRIYSQVLTFDQPRSQEPGDRDTRTNGLSLHANS